MPKHYYLIGEVAKMLGIKKHTLRYWEAEFPKLRPKKITAENGIIPLKI